MSNKSDDAKEETKVLSFRVPMSDYVEFLSVKAEHAHPLVADTALFVEAFRLYIRLAKERGLTPGLQVRDDVQGGEKKKPPSRAANDKHHPR